MSKLKLAILTMCWIWLAACGQVRHKLELTDGYRTLADTRIVVGQVHDLSGKHQDLKPAERLRNALVEALKAENLLWANDGKPLVLDAEIVEYEPGNAFKRWLLPGYGSTILSVRARLKEEDRTVGMAEARRTVSFGGGYSIGAWKGIFQDVAEDLVEDIQAKLNLASGS